MPTTTPNCLNPKNTDMKKCIINVIVFAGAVLLVFLLTGFIRWDWNIAEWDKNTRLGTILIGACVYWLGYVFNQIDE